MSWKEEIKDPNFTFAFCAFLFGIVIVIFLSIVTYNLFFNMHRTDAYYIDRDYRCIMRDVKWAGDESIYCSFDDETLYEHYLEIRECKEVMK